MRIIPPVTSKWLTEINEVIATYIHKEKYWSSGKRAIANCSAMYYSVWEIMICIYVCIKWYKETLFLNHVLNAELFFQEEV